MLWFNFILGLIFISLCYKLIIIHYHAQKQRKIKIKLRIKLNHNIDTVTRFVLYTALSICNKFKDVESACTLISPISVSLIHSKIRRVFSPLLISCRQLWKEFALTIGYKLF